MWLCSVIGTALILCRYEELKAAGVALEVRQHMPCTCTLFLTVAHARHTVLHCGEGLIVILNHSWSEAAMVGHHTSSPRPACSTTYSLACQSVWVESYNEGSEPSPLSLSL